MRLEAEKQKLNVTQRGKGSRRSLSEVEIVSSESPKRKTEGGPKSGQIGEKDRTHSAAYGQCTLNIKKQ